MNKKIVLTVLLAVVSALGISVVIALSTNMGHPYEMRELQQTTPSQPGMMHDFMVGVGGSQMMRSVPMSMGCNMGGMMGGPYNSNSFPIGREAAEQLAQGYLAALNNPDLEIDELEEYSNNYYVSFRERSTGMGAFEIIIDRFYETVHPEPQSMMWNLKYGMMGSRGSVTMPITPKMAMNIAQQYLNVAYPGTKVSSIVTYYGYYTIMATLNGEHYGMLSVNGYTGQVWYHTWHGMFLGENED